MMTLAHRRSVDRVRAVSTESVRERYGELNGDRELDRVPNEVETRLDAERAREAMRSLTEIERQAVMLSYFGGFSQTEVARFLGLPLGTAQSRIRDGLIGLRNALGVGT
jgi:RNA polymerase sigma-70 factor (ECF subfamily)